MRYVYESRSYEFTTVRYIIAVLESVERYRPFVLVAGIVYFSRDARNLIKIKIKILLSLSLSFLVAVKKSGQC
jgi:hypothetical protein